MSLLFWSSVKYLLQAFCLILIRYIETVFVYREGYAHDEQQESAFIRCCGTCDGLGNFRNAYDIRSYRIYDQRDDYVQCQTCRGSGYYETTDTSLVQSLVLGRWVLTDYVSNIIILMIISFIIPPGFIYAVALNLHWSIKLLDIVFLLNVTLVYVLHSDYYLCLSLIVLMANYFLILGKYFF